jgi:hypothetical protein
MREIARILRPEAPAVVLIDREMLDDVLRAVEAASLSVEADYLVYRASGMRARLLVMELDS